ncbi:MAG: Mur ligase family protein [Thermomicrobiales bacterium]
MRLIEIRDLDGPNIFLLEPAIKLEIEVHARDLTPDAVADLAARMEPLAPSDDERATGADGLGDLLMAACADLHERAGVEFPEMRWAPMETPGSWSLAFGWERRQFALALARLLADIATGEEVDLRAAAAGLHDLLTGDDPEDRPGMIRDDRRAIPVIAVTGTNGKTTTTRLIAHILRGTGRKVGWTSTVGVFIEGENVLEGDYTGPAGAWRVLREPGLDVAVLETARGGILLRGMACQSNDVSVMTNISGDHLGLHGVHTVEGLAEVKGVVLRTTRSDGWVVLNADDPLVRGQAAGLHASIIWVSQNPRNPTVAAHRRTGGRAVLTEGGWLVDVWGNESHRIVRLDEMPIAFGGQARHMIENALCAAAATLALDLNREEVAAGLRGFGTDAEDNPGRLNIYDLNGATVILDYAHNTVGLTHLLQVARGFLQGDGRLTAIIGTAGDRTDEALRELGRIAAAQSDHIIVKETRRYLRGRKSVDEMTALYREGLAAGGNPPHTVAADEPEALAMALRDLNPGDVVAMMCIESGPQSRARVEALGGLMKDGETARRQDRKEG